MSTYNILRQQQRLAYGLIPLLNLLQERGVDTQEFLTSQGIPTFGLTDPSYTISIEREAEIISVGLARVGDSGMGLELARRTHLHNFSVFGLAIKTCARAKDVLQLTLRYPELVWGSSNMVQSESQDHVVTRFLCGPTELDITLMLRDIGCGVLLMSEALQRQFEVEEVRLSISREEAPEDTAAFFESHVRFDAEDNAIIIKKETLSWTLPGADSLAHAFYIAQCDQMVADMRQPFSYTRAVRERLVRNTPVPNLETIAFILNMSPRTLQRRLSNEGSSFSKLLQQVRLDRATSALERMVTPIEKIAEDLGFKDSVAFSHAFKSWTGVSPRNWNQ